EAVGAAEQRHALQAAIEEGDEAAADEVVREDADQEREHEHAQDAQTWERVAEETRAELVGEEAVDAADDGVDEPGGASDGREQHDAGDELVLEQAAEALHGRQSTGRAADCR